MQIPIDYTKILCEAQISSILDQLHLHYLVINNFYYMYHQQSDSNLMTFI